MKRLLIPPFHAAAALLLCSVALFMGDALCRAAGAAQPPSADSPTDGNALTEEIAPTEQPRATTDLGSGPESGSGTEAKGEPPQDAPWVELFDDAGNESWVRRGGRAEFEVVDGAILGTSRSGTPNSFLCTPDEFGDFELQFECRIEPGLNAGVQIRSHSRDDRVYGLQVEIDPSQRSWTGGIYDEGRSGWRFTLENQPEARAAFRAEQWNRIRVVARGPRIQTWVNDLPAADFRQALEEQGFIALQVHSTPSPDPLRVWWRNLRIRPLE